MQDAVVGVSSPPLPFLLRFYPSLLPFLARVPSSHRFLTVSLCFPRRLPSPPPPPRFIHPFTPNSNSHPRSRRTKSSSKTSMCVLHSWTAPLDKKNQGLGFYNPLGRSVPTVPSDVYHAHAHAANSSSAAVAADYYDGLGDWTRPPGKSAHYVAYECGVASNSGTNFVQGEYLCEVTLPATKRRNALDPTMTDHFDIPYYLTYYERDLSVRNELSRFLQKNTFGPTPEILDAMEIEYEGLRAEAEAAGGGRRDLPRRRHGATPAVVDRRSDGPVDLRRGRIHELA